MTDLKVSRGDPVRASAWNELVERVAQNVNGSPANIASRHRNEISCVNDSGRDYEIGEAFVVSYNGPTSGDMNDIVSVTILSGDEPSWHTGLKNLAVAAEPIPDGDTGIVVLSGLCIIRATAGTDDFFAMPNPATPYQFKTTDTGIARVLGRIDTNNVLADLGFGSDLWRYELTEDSGAPSTTTAKLLSLNGSEFAGSSYTITLKDPDSLMSDQVSTEKGWCRQVGNQFFAIQAPCSS